MQLEQRLSGLSNDQVHSSRKKHGRNIITKIKKKGFIKILLGNFNDPMMKILLFALVINCIFFMTARNYLEVFGIAFAIILSVVVSTLSEIGSEAAFKKLQQNISRTTVRVRRDKKMLQIGADEIVVGDIIILSPGEKIGADGILINGNLEVDQSTLNGEAKEAKKHVIDHSLTQFCDDLLHPQMLFNGTIVSGGEGFMEVSAIGDKTTYGKLARGLQESAPNSPLKEKLEHLAKRISRFGYIAAVLVFLSYIINALFISHPVSEISQTVTDFRMMFQLFINALTLAVSVMVMSVPEGLPMMITVVLTVNTRRMMKDKVLVRKLNSIDTAGTLNILFTDKTGTLTNGHLTVSDIIDGNGIRFDAHKFDSTSSLGRLLVASLCYNNAAGMSDENAIGGNATDRCLLEYANPYNKDLLLNIHGKIPFNSKQKYMATRVSGDYNLTLIKGAPEKIIEQCRYYYTTTGKRELLKEKNTLIAQLEHLNNQAIRVIAVATSEADVNGDYFNNLTFVGLVGIHDQIRSEVKKGVMSVQGAGIQVVMITGDALKTAEAIAEKTGIINAKSNITLTSDQLKVLSDDQLLKILPDLRVVARAKPEDKLRLVKIAQRANLVVGMTGDGVNDAPALKCADVGFAMGSGMDISKEAGDIIITDDDFASIGRAIVYGRTIFKSIRKFIIFQLTINFSAVIVSIVAPLINVEMPISVIQILWINLVIDTLAGLAFGGERPRNTYMQEPPKKRGEMIINGYMWQQIIVTTIYCCALSLFFLKVLIGHGIFADKSSEYVRTAYFSLFMFMAIFNSFNARTHKTNLFDYLVLNKQFVWIIGIISIIQFVLIYAGKDFFDTVALNFTHLVIIILLAFTIVPLDLLRKSINRKKSGT